MVEVAVLLRDRKVKTECLLPVNDPTDCSGEYVSPYEDAPEP